MDCSRCLNKLSAESMDLQQIGIDLTLGKLNCTSCRLCVCVRLDNNWQNIESVLQNRKRNNGWRKVTEKDDKIRFYVLSQIMYNEVEGQVKDDEEAFFDLPDEKDLVKILWENGSAVGFYTVKMKESLVLDKMQMYEMTTLDTAYIRRSHRRRGLGASILQDIVQTFPGEDIALSTPVSFSMYHVVHKFLKTNPSFKTKLWEISGVGSQGDRKLICCTLKKQIGI